MDTMNEMGSAGFFGIMNQTAAGSTDFGQDADVSASAGQFAALLEGKTVTPETLNSEAAFSVEELFSSEEGDLIHKIESLSEIDALLKRVSVLLGLNVDMEQSLNKVDPEEVPEEMVSQLADFLAGIKEFSELLHSTSESGEDIEINGEIISGNDLKVVSGQLAQEGLNLEIQFNKLDISEEITLKLAEIQNREITGTGLAVAVNPKELTGSPIPESLTALLEKEETELEDLISNIRLLATTAKREADGTVSLNILSKQGEGVKEALIKSSYPNGEQLGNKGAEAGVNSDNNILQSASDVQPVSSDVQPVLSDVLPVLSDVQPVLTDIQPVSSEVQPVITDVQPVITDVQPVITDVQPVITDVQPVSSEVQAVSSESLLSASEIATVNETSDIESDVSDSFDSEFQITADFVESDLNGKSGEDVDGDDENSRKTFMKMMEALGDETKDEDGNDPFSITSDDSADPADSLLTAANSEELADFASLDVEGDSRIVMNEMTETKAPRAHTPRSFEQMVMDQVSGKLADAAKEGVREITLVLKPELLGEVKLTIQLEGDLVAAKLQVESQQVKQIVESNLQTLRDALAEQNLRAGSLDVNVGNGENQRNAEEHSPSRRRKREMASSEIAGWMRRRPATNSSSIAASDTWNSGSLGVT